MSQTLLSTYLYICHAITLPRRSSLHLTLFIHCAWEKDILRTLNQAVKLMITASAASVNKASML